MAFDYKSGLTRYRRYLQIAAERPLFRASAFVIFSLTLVIVLILLALRPTLITVAELLGQINSRKQIVDQLNQKLVSVQRASAVLDEQRSRLHLLDAALPKSPAWSAWAQEIFDIASGSGLKLEAITVGPVLIAGTEPVKAVDQVKMERPTKTMAPPGVTSVPFLVTAKGEYGQIKAYVAALEKTPRVAILSQVKIVKEKDGSLILTVEGAVGYAREETKAP